jgi:DNA adenine methylase
MVETKLQKPFLKWVGGKTQIINDIIKRIPKEMNNYNELFVGGGSVLLAVLSLQKSNDITIHGEVRAYDKNHTLINVYKDIQTNKNELFKHVKHYITEYDSLTGHVINRKAQTLEDAKSSKESYYYWVRNKYNHLDDGIEKSAIFMFLNKTCFRGLYREGPNGFNVPYGHYKKTPTVITEDELNCVSDLIKDVIFEDKSYESSILDVEEGDYVYIDPPYVPEKMKKSFVDYTQDGFNLDEHNALFEEIKKLNERQIKFSMSNAKVNLVVNTFSDYQYDDIDARRAINSKKPGSKTKEVLIYN